MTEPVQASWALSAGDFRFLLLGEARRLLIDARQAAERAEIPVFVSRQKAELIRRRSITEATSDLVTFADGIAEIFPSLGPTVDATKLLAAEVKNAADAAALSLCVDRLAELFGQPAHPAGAPPISLKASERGLTIEIGEETAAPVPGGGAAFGEALSTGSKAQRYLAAVSETIAAARAAGRGLSGLEQIARAAAWQTLEIGHTLPSAFQSIGTSGFRRWQTCLSLADPGEGHNLVTCLDDSLLAGTVVHVEHIDRGNQTDREIIEAYRIPAPLSAARVRLQVGVAAPTTAYIGRPAFENGVVPDGATYQPMARYFEDDLLKAAHMTASACTVMFGNGVADCKIAIERMSAREAVRFMAAVAGNVSRDQSRQFLSAAFNINMPLLDDRDPVAPRWVGERIKVAHLAIEIAEAGSFDKVTWDGASNQPKSEPIIAAFSPAEWLALIHRAHERGLETYISAGMDKSHMTACVECGVDGVGIGTSMHYLRRTREGKLLMGELQPAAVREVLATRDTAAKTVKGRGTETLVMLDRLAYERLLSPAVETIRQALFADLSASKMDEAAIESRLAALAGDAFWRAIEKHKAESFDKHPAIAQAERRLIAAEQLTPDLQMAGAERTDPNARLRDALARRDITDIREALR